MTKTFECCDQCKQLYPEGSLRKIAVMITEKGRECSPTEQREHYLFLCDNCIEEAENKGKKILPRRALPRPNRGEVVKKG